MEEASSIGLTVVTVTDCRVEDIESGKYQLIFGSAKNALVKPFFLLIKKKTTSFYQSMPVCIKQIVACKPSSAVVSALSIV